MFLNQLNQKSVFIAQARTALKCALQDKGISTGDKILVPEYICDVIIQTLLQLGITPVYYPLFQNLSPHWEILKSLVCQPSLRALIMVHYFGQPQSIEQFQSFCLHHNLLLIEDNAHGHGGTLAGKLLGSFGDIGISSPRKILGTPSGGVLYGATDFSIRLSQNMKSFPFYRARSVIKTILRSSQPAWRFVKGWSDRGKNWSNPYLHQESVQPDYGIDEYSRRRIISANWQSIAERRRKNWSAWSRFALSKGLRPVYSEVHRESCPWGMPVYASALAERNSWLEWGAKNRVALFPWPALPKDIISLGGDALERWKVFLCFPLDSSPSELGV